MKRTFSILAVAAVAAATLGAAAPANAAESPHCELLVRSPDVVEIGPGRVDIYPSNAGPYVSHVVAAANAYVNCLVNETVGPVVACANAFVANRPTVTVNIQTLQITIDYSEFLGTSCAI